MFFEALLIAQTIDYGTLPPPPPDTWESIPIPVKLPPELEPKDLPSAFREAIEGCLDYRLGLPCDRTEADRILGLMRQEARSRAEFGEFYPLK